MVKRAINPVGVAAALLLAAILSPSFLWGLDLNRKLTQYSPRVWLTQPGLPPGTAIYSYHLWQTGDGYLWTATQNGLFRTDGIRFTSASSLFPGLPENVWVRDGFTDSHRNYWIGTVGAGVFEASYKNGLKHYTNQNGLPSNSVRCLVPGGGGSVWVCTDHGLARLDAEKDGRVESFGIKDGLGSEGITAACVAQNGKLWAAGRGPYLNLWNGAQRFSRREIPGLPSDLAVFSLLCSGDDVWVGTNVGLVRVSNSGSRLYTVKDGLADNLVFTLAAGKNQVLWIGTLNGFSRLHEGEFDSFRAKNGLSQGAVLSIYEDREGSVWVGTKRGLNQFVDSRGVPYTTTEGLPSNDIGPVLQDRKGVIWVGTLDAGLARLEGRRFRSVNPNRGSSFQRVQALVEGNDGTLWAGTVGGALHLSDGHLLGTYTRQQGLPADAVNSLYRDRSGTIWAGTSAGLAVFTRNQFQPVVGAPRGEIRGIAQGSSGIVVATDSGVYRLRGSTFDEILWKGAPIRRANGFYVDSQGFAWITLSGGGVRLIDGSEVYGFDVTEGLFDSEIFGMTEDSQDRFWMLSSRGIFSVKHSDLRAFAAGTIPAIHSDPQDLRDMEHALEARSGPQPGLWRTEDGRLWSSTAHGLFVLDPKAVRAHENPPPVVIENAIVNGRPEKPGDIGKMAPGQKNIQFNYTGLSLLAPTQITFRYLLEGFDSNWIDAGTRREAYYTNLPPGRFRFRVTACNVENQCSPTGAALAFALEPNYYQREWFWPAIAALIAGLVFLGYRLRIHRLRGKYDLILNERSRIARELHDTLMQGFSGVTIAIQAVAARLGESEERQRLEKVLQNAETCIQETRRSIEGLRSPHAEDYGFAAAVANTARDIVGAEDIRLKLRLDQRTPSPPREIEYNLLRVMAEAISNSVKHSGARNIEVAMKSNAELLCLMVSDDGIGFAGTKYTAHPGHYGLIGMQERARQIGAKFELRSEPGSGTIVTVSLPSLAGDRVETAS